MHIHPLILDDLHYVEDLILKSTNNALTVSLEHWNASTKLRLQLGFYLWFQQRTPALYN